MYASISRWGNSQGLRLPKSMLESVGLHENDQVELSCHADTITIRKVRATQHRTLEERLTSFYGLPLESISPITQTEEIWDGQAGQELW